MSKVIISSDSISDLGEELLTRFAIPTIPLHVVLGEDVHEDGVDVAADDVFRFYDENGTLPHTTAINVGEYTEFFEKLTADGSSVVHFCTGSAISSCYQNALIAKEEFENVYVVDSLNLSTGVGLQVLAAAENAQAGLSAAEIYEKALELVPRVEASFFLDTLEYLHKGGRCSALAAFGANLLKLRPTILVDASTGKMDVGKKNRGTYDKVMEAYIRDRIEGRADIDHHRCFITHSGNDPETVQKAVDLVKSLYDFDEVCVTRALCTISSHCGPHCMGVLFIRNA